MKNLLELEEEAASRLKKLDWVPPLLARATLATAFWVSGRGKFKHLKKDVAFFEELGIPAPKIMAPLVAAIEVGGASLLASGLLARTAALALIPIMGVALGTAKKKEFKSFSELTGVYEFAYVLLLSYLLVNGAGRASLAHIGSTSLRRQIRLAS